MTDDRPIKVHVDEKMREHMAFIVRHYYIDLLREISTLGEACSEGTKLAWREELALTEACLKELEQAGT